MTSRYPMMVCEHESAHAAVARHYGVRVREIRVDEPEPGTGGWCQYRRSDWFPPDVWGGRALEAIATAMAPELWLTRRRRGVYARPDAGCGSDRQAASEVLRAVFPSSASAARSDFRSRAERAALAVLEAEHDTILEMATQLARHGGWQLGKGYGRVRQPYRRAVRPPGATPPAPVRSAPAGPGGLFADLRTRIRSGELTWHQANQLATAAGYPSQILGSPGQTRIGNPVGPLRHYCDGRHAA